MYSEALKQIREARNKPTGAVSSGGSAGSPTGAGRGRSNRRLSKEERRRFYEQRGFAPAVSPEVATLASTGKSDDGISQGGN